MLTSTRWIGLGYGFGVEQYFYELNLEQIRDRFRIQSEMYGDFKGSFPTKYRKQGISLKCDLCKQLFDDSTNSNDTLTEFIESPTHYLEFCPLVSDIKEQHDTDTDLGIIQFFRAVMERRSEMLDN